MSNSETSDPAPPFNHFLPSSCQVPAIDPANPKDVIGSKKIALSAYPAVALAHGAAALMNGRKKYGPYNWRDTKVRASVYVDAALRHLLSWYEGEDLAADSGIHHLGHLLAGISIVLDAEANGCLIDDRPIGQNAHLASRVFDSLAESLQA